MGTRYTVVRNLGSFEHINNAKILVHALGDMMAELRNKIYPLIVWDSNMKWLMTQDMFNRIIVNCGMEYGFTWQMELSCTEQNRYTIMDVEVEFVNDEAFRRNNLVELTYREPYAVTINWNPNSYSSVSVRDAIESMPWFKELGKDYHLADYEKEYLADYSRKDAEATWECFNEIWNLNQAGELLENAYNSMQSIIRNDIEARKENKTMPIYVGYGKKVTIENVIFNNPATIVMWSDGTKTVVKRQKGDKKFDPEKGLAMAICKKVMGNKGNFNDIFKEWIEED